MSKKLFTPGPINVPQFVRVQMSKDVIHHRMGDFKTILYRITDKLKTVFKTNNDVLILTSSGTGAMESAVVNLFSAGDEVLVINTGFFGERFVEITTTFQLKVYRLDYEWGTTYNLTDVKKMFADHPGIKGVFVTYHETSTGVLNDVKTLGEFVNTTNAVLITDCISGMVIHPFEFDNWHIDCALASSQKGFLLPPGLAFVALSNKAKKAMEVSALPKFYWNYKKYIEYYKKGQNPYTPAISLILALDVALNSLVEKGVDKIIEEKEELRRYTETKFVELGFVPFIKDEKLKGNALVPVLANGLYNISGLVDFLDSRYNLSVSKGQGPYTELMLRVGIISDFTKEDIDELVDRVLEYRALEEGHHA